MISLIPHLASPVSSHFADEWAWLSLTGPRFPQSSKGAEPCPSSCMCVPGSPQVENKSPAICTQTSSSPRDPWDGTPGSVGCLNSVSTFFWRKGPELSLNLLGVGRLRTIDQAHLGWSQFWPRVGPPSFPLGSVPWAGHFLSLR